MSFGTQLPPLARGPGTQVGQPFPNLPVITYTASNIIKEDALTPTSTATNRRGQVTADYTDMITTTGDKAKWLTEFRDLCRK